jgi:hypothetical protein
LRKSPHSISLAIALAVAIAALACGRKADPQPAELVRPKRITNLTAKPVKEGVRLEWSRPETYVNGKRMDDLGGFLVFRGESGSAVADEVGTIEVSDRERFQRERKFTFIDGKVEKGKSYFYRVVSFTTDKYYSDPSNQVVVKVEDAP